MNEFLCENLKKIEDNIAAACQKAGRDRSEVTLIAVSKTKPELRALHLERKAGRDLVAAHYQPGGLPGRRHLERHSEYQ